MGRVNTIFYSSVMLNTAAEAAGISLVQAKRLAELLTAGMIESQYIGMPHGDLFVYTARASPELAIQQE